MANNDPPSPTPGPTGDPESTDEDALRRLQHRLDRASEAAERLIAEAAARVASPLGEAGEGANPGETGEGGREVPSAGWQIPRYDEGRDRTARNSGSGVQGEVDLLLHVFRSLRDRIPPELQRRLGEAVREVLLALRALIDWYLERAERHRTEPVEVQDIPIL